MILDIFNTCKDGRNCLQAELVFQDMKDLNVEILANNNQFRLENKLLKQQLQDIKDYLSADCDASYLPNRMMNE